MSSNPVVRKALSLNAPYYGSMDKDISKVRVDLEHFKHQGKAVRHDVYDIDRLESFFINIDARNEYQRTLRKLRRGESHDFEIHPTLKVKISPV